MGLIMAAMVASLLLSADSSLNSLATIFTNDFYLRWINPAASERSLVRVGRWASVVILVVTCIRALTLQETPSLMQFLQVGLAYLAAPVVVVFVAGIFWRGATSAAAVVTLIASPFICLACQSASQWASWWPEHLVYWLPIAVALLCLLLISISLVTKRKSDAELRGLIWSRKMSLAAAPNTQFGNDQMVADTIAERTTLFRDHRLWAAVAIVLMIVEVYLLR